MKVKSTVGFATMFISLTGLSATWDVSLTAPDADGLTGVHSLTNALAKSANYDTIRIAPGEYDLSDLQPMTMKEWRAFIGGVEVSDSNGAAYLIVDNKKLTIEGTVATAWAEKDSAEETVLKVTDASARILYAYAGYGRQSIFRHLTFDGGNSTGAGGAIYFTDGTQGGYATNCVFRNCKSANLGGATCNVSALGCLYRNNYAVYGGAYYGSIWSAQSMTNMCCNCVFWSNSAKGSSADYGGGAICCSANETESLIVQGCVFEGNTCGKSGGAVYTRGGQTLTGCSFVTNSVTGTSTYGGGAVASATGYVNLKGCAFTNNTAVGNGGAVKCATTFDGTNCSFAANSTSQGSGGAVECATIGTIADCVFGGNSAKVNAGGVYAPSISGTLRECAFHSNTNSETAFGAHFNLAQDVIRCKFSGYGDVCAKNYDACEFNGCEYRYAEPSYGADEHGLITYPSGTGGGVLRNCLVHNCHVSRIIASGGVRVDVENCTFADNTAENENGFSVHFYAFRGNGIPSTNVFANCIFADNRVLKSSRVDEDCDAFFMGSSSPQGHTIVSNCMYRHEAKFVNGSHAEFSFDKGEPRFVMKDKNYPKAPYYMIRRRSDARGAGIWLDWMDGSADYAGKPYEIGSAIDLGCYQCDLAPVGMLLLFK